MIGLGFFIIKPFVLAFITGSVLAVLSFPLFQKAHRITKSVPTSALIVTFIVMAIILIPLVIMMGVLSQEAYVLFSNLQGESITFATDVYNFVCIDSESFSCSVATMFVSTLPEPDLDYYTNSLILKATSFIAQNVSALLISLPKIALNFFVMLFVLYYLLKDHKAVMRRIDGLLPLTKPHRDHVVKKFKDVTFAVFYGHLFVALIQGVMAGLGYWAVGVESAVVWASLTILFALLPFLGTAVIWLPLSLNFLVKGFLGNEFDLIVRGCLLLLYGVLVVGTIDNFLRPKIIGSKADVHPVLVLLGVLGGLSLFGFIGLIIGPVLLSILMVLVDIYEEEKKEITSYFG